MERERKVGEIRSKATKIKSLIKKQKGLWGEYQSTREFKEPVMFLMRNNRKIEFYENCTQGKFPFTHTDATDRFLDLSPQFLHTFDYGKKEFKGYVCHEDFPTPLPEIPIVTAEMYQMGIEKTLNDIKKWKAEEAKALGDMWYKIAMGIAMILGVVIIGKLIVPNFHIPFFDSKVAETVANPENAKEIVDNATTIVRNITAFR